MQVVHKKISIEELKTMSQKMFGGLVKAVVDIEQEIMAVDAELHVDEETVLLEEHNSQQKNLWGINIFPHQLGNNGFIVFDSMINVRPSQGNRSRSVDDSKLQEKIRAVVHKLITP